MDAFTHVDDPRLLRLTAYWLERADGRAMPGRKDVDPLDFPWALQMVWLCDYERESGRFRYRVAGEEINAVYGRNLAGLYLDEIILPWGLATVAERYRACIETPAVVHVVGRVYMRADKAFVGERITLPLADEAGRPAMLLGATAYTVSPGGRKAPFDHDEQRITVTPIPTDAAS